MSALTFLTELAADRSGAISFVPERCLRRRLTSWQCSRCADVCPREALTIRDNQIRFDGERCSSCMACTASCPNDAFVSDGFDLNQRLQALPARRETVISCSRRRQLHADEFVIPCLGGLGLEHLLCLMMNLPGRVIFDTSPCESCENGAVSRRFAGLVSWLQNGDTPVLRLEQAAPEIKETNGSRSSGNRRSYLAGIGNSLTSILAARFSRPSEVSSGGSGQRRVPDKVKLVRGMLKNLEGKQAELVASFCLHHVHVGSTCTACPRCKGICPTGAIRIEKTGKDKTLKIDKTLCSGCGLCVAFCKHDALFLEKPQDWETYSLTPGRHEISLLSEPGANNPGGRQ